MTIDINTMISITEANNNISKVAGNEDVFAISEKLITQTMEEYEVLAKWLFKQITYIKNLNFTV